MPAVPSTPLADSERFSRWRERSSVKLFSPSLLAVALLTSACETIPTAIEESPAVIVSWESEEGIKRLERSKSKFDFFKLANQFESQTNKVFCGPTSGAVVLNTLRRGQTGFEPPRDDSSLPAEDRAFLPAGFDPIFQRYTQNNLFRRSPKSRAEVLGHPVDLQGKTVKDFGYQIRQFYELLRAHDLDATLRIVDEELAPATVRDELARNMRTRDDYVIVNYKRAALGQKGGGHISPLGAYDEGSDSFLVLDVNPNKAGWVWVKTDTLVAAMKTFDTVENRGYVLVKEGERAQEESHANTP